MRTPTLLTLALSTLALAACNPFNRGPVTEVSRDTNLNARWNASLVTPAALAGAVQMKGAASMQPGPNSENTDFRLTVENATPGGLHPWRVQHGQCGADEGVFGSAEAYRPMKVGDDGRGETGATIREQTPSMGSYSVVVYASAANPGTVLACGNLAPPAR